MGEGEGEGMGMGKIEMGVTRNYFISSFLEINFRFTFPENNIWNWLFHAMEFGKLPAP